ncbi:MAG: carbon storage regulator, partial [Thermoguttaceae bacterium]|nr:carbon storage regulator [Thermoguttaceae bacterium]
MLALTRRINESVIINHNIKIVIVDVSGDKVRVGVEA